MEDNEVDIEIGRGCTERGGREDGQTLAAEEESDGVLGEERVVVTGDSRWV